MLGGVRMFLKLFINIRLKSPMYEHQLEDCFKLY